MSWSIEHKNGITYIAHNGETVNATMLDFHAEVGHAPTATIRIVFMKHDRVDLLMKDVKVIEEDYHE